MLQILSHKKRRAFYESQLGKKASLLVENENQNGFLHGFTENYVKVKIPYDPLLINTIQEIKLEEIDRDGVFISSVLSDASKKTKEILYGS